MRLQPRLANLDELRDFVEWILKVGDGKLGGPNDGEATIDIPKDLLIKDASDPMDAIIDSTYPRILEGSIDSLSFYNRAILALTNEIVDKVNESLFLGEERLYLSLDSISKSDSNYSSNDDEFQLSFLTQYVHLEFLTIIFC